MRISWLSKTLEVSFLLFGRTLASFARFADIDKFPRERNNHVYNTYIMRVEEFLAPRDVPATQKTEGSTATGCVVYKGATETLDFLELYANVKCMVSNLEKVTDGVKNMRRIFKYNVILNEDKIDRIPEPEKGKENMKNIEESLIKLWRGSSNLLDRLLEDSGNVTVNDGRVLQRNLYIIRHFHRLITKITKKKNVEPFSFYNLFNEISTAFNSSTRAPVSSEASSVQISLTTDSDLTDKIKKEIESLEVQLSRYIISEKKSKQGVQLLDSFSSGIKSAELCISDSIDSICREINPSEKLNILRIRICQGLMISKLHILNIFTRLEDGQCKKEDAGSLRENIEKYVCCAFLYSFFDFIDIRRFKEYYVRSISGCVPGSSIPKFLSRINVDLLFWDLPHLMSMPNSIIEKFVQEADKTREQNEKIPDDERTITEKITGYVKNLSDCVPPILVAKSMIDESQDERIQKEIYFSRSVMENRDDEFSTEEEYIEVKERSNYITQKKMIYGKAQDLSILMEFEERAKIGTKYGPTFSEQATRYYRIKELAKVLLDIPQFKNEDLVYKDGDFNSQSCMSEFWTLTNSQKFRTKVKMHGFNKKFQKFIDELKPKPEDKKIRLAINYIKEKVKTKAPKKQKDPNAKKTTPQDYEIFKKASGILFVVCLLLGFIAIPVEDDDKRN